MNNHLSRDCSRNLKNLESEIGEDCFFFFFHSRRPRKGNQCIGVEVDLCDLGFPNSRCYLSSVMLKTPLDCCPNSLFVPVIVGLLEATPLSCLVLGVNEEYSKSGSDSSPIGR